MQHNWRWSAVTFKVLLLEWQEILEDNDGHLLGQPVR